MIHVSRRPSFRVPQLSTPHIASQHTEALREPTTETIAEFQNEAVHWEECASHSCATKLCAIYVGTDLWMQFISPFAVMCTTNAISYECRVMWVAIVSLLWLMMYSRRNRMWASIESTMLVVAFLS